MTPTNDHSLPFEIDVQTVRNLLMEQSPLVLLDCREAQEHAFCRLESAIWIPIRETPSRLDELQPHKLSRIVVYCHHGIRSQQVTHFLRSEGFLQTQSMAGGIDAWSRLIDVEVPRY